MWNEDSMYLYSQYLSAQDQAVLEAMIDGIVLLDQVKVFVAAKLKNDIDQEYISQIWDQNMEDSYDSF